MAWVAFDNEFIVRRYEHEIERRDRLTSAIELPTAVLTALSGAVVTMVRDLAQPRQESDWLLVFWLLVAVDAALFMLCALHLLRSYVDQEFSSVPPVDVLADDRVTYLSGLTEAQQAAGREVFDAQLLRRFADAASANQRRNDRRSEELFRLRRVLAWLLIAVSTTAGPYLILKASE